MITSEEIKRRLWNGANELRGSMDASRYKDYMLGLMFYKFLSDRTLDELNRLGQYDLPEYELVEKYFEAHKELGDQIITTIQGNLGYCIEPHYLYQTWIRDINNGEFEVQKITDSFNTFERSISMSTYGDDFKGLFANSTLDLSDTALGSNLNERSKNIKALILLFADLNMVELQDGDALGNAYEYLIGQFAMESGKKAGEFYTPRQVSEVMAQIVARSGRIHSIYDPAVGSGSLLLTVGRHLDRDSQSNLHYFGQEKNTATYNLTRMNLLLHGVNPQKMTIRNGDTLAEDWPEDPKRPNEGVQFDAVVMNPPYSLKRWNRADITVSDPRFESVGVLPPDAKGDYAFLLHGLYHLNTNGTMAIVLPHGVLFRGGAEGIIRQRLLEKNQIDTIIGLPAGMFSNTGIPVTVMILKKNRPIDEPVLIIDGSRGFVKQGKQNVLREKDIAKLVDTYLYRSVEEGYSYLVPRDEIIENDYNLNIPRYVDSGTSEIPHDVDGHLHGGIPESNIEDLHILNRVVPEVLERALREIRPGYSNLEQPTEELRNEVMNHARVKAKADEVYELTTEFVKGYWDRLHGMDQIDEVPVVMEEMLLGIKKLLGDFRFVDIYDGYQIIAESWQESILTDMELITAFGIYGAGRQRVPNLVTKGSGSNKRQQQDGWIGSIVPNHLVEAMLFQDDKEKISQKQQLLDETDTQLTELVEASKIEDSEEYNALYDALKKNSEDEPGDTFDAAAAKSELNAAEAGSQAYELLNQVSDLMKTKNQLSREIKNDKITLDKNVQERILTLTDEEIDALMYEKWFGNVSSQMVSLVLGPLKKDLSTLEMLHNRYKETISDYDAQINELESEINAHLNDMVITYE